MSSPIWASSTMHSPMDKNRCFTRSPDVRPVRSRRLSGDRSARLQPPDLPWTDGRWSRKACTGPARQRQACGVTSRHGDGFFFGAIRPEPDNRSMTVLRDPQITPGIGNRAIWTIGPRRQIKQNLGISLGPAVAPKPLRPDLAGRSVREIGQVARRCETDRIRNGNTGIKLSHLTAVVAPDGPGPGRLGLAHGPEPEPALRIGAAIIASGFGSVGFDAAQPVLRPCFNVEKRQAGFRGDDDPRFIDPARGADIFIELPRSRFGILAGVKPMGIDVEPEQLLSQRMPQRAFAQIAGRGIVYGDARHRRFRAARLRINADVPKIHSGQSEDRRTVLLSVPNAGSDMFTTSSTWWVNPCPGASRSCTGANIVPQNSMNPSGYW